MNSQNKKNWSNNDKTSLARILELIYSNQGQFGKTHSEMETHVAALELLLSPLYPVDKVIEAIRDLGLKMKGIPTAYGGPGW